MTTLKKGATTMYDKDKRQRITLRLTDEQFAFVKQQCEALGVTPSDYIRMLVNGVVYASKHTSVSIKEELREKVSQGGFSTEELVGVLGRENDKTDSNDKLQ